MRKEIEQFVGKKGEVFAGGMTVKVEVKDVKQSYGRTRYLITPIAGSGEVWVENVKIDDKSKKGKE